MLLKFYVDEAKDTIEALLDYQDGADEIHSLLGNSLVSKLQNVYDELEFLSHQLDFE